MKIKNQIIISFICLIFFINSLLIVNEICINYDRSQKVINNHSHLDGLSNRFVSNEEAEIFWFLHITDTQFVWANQKNIDTFNSFLNQTHKVIKPLFIINTGDIVDANNGMHQNVEEWQKYNNSLTANNITSSNYIDLVGNHDGSENPQYSFYINYSITGRKYNTTQISFNHSFSCGNYAFIGINTAKDSYANLIEFAFAGFLDTEKLDWYEGELKKYKNYDNIIVFGHHPPEFPLYYKIISNLSSTGKTFFDLNHEFNVKYYFCGHIHSNFIEKRNGLTTIITDNFDDNNGTYRIVAMSKNQISTSIENVGKWPQGLIIYPPDSNLYDPKYFLDKSKIQVLAWDPKGLVNVEWCICLENGKVLKDWMPLKKDFKNEALWEADFPNNFKNSDNYIIKVKINGVSGQTIRTIRYAIPVFINLGLIFLILIYLSLGIIFVQIILLNSKKVNFSNKLRSFIKKNNMLDKICYMRCNFQR